MKSKYYVFIVLAVFISACSVKRKFNYIDTKPAPKKHTDTCFVLQKEIKVTGMVDTLMGSYVHSVSSGFVMVHFRKPFLYYLDHSGKLIKKIEYEIKWPEIFKKAFPGGVPDSQRPFILSAADSNSNVYVFVEVNKSILIFDSEGNKSNEIKVKDPEMIRHMCVNKEGLIFTHRAPTKNSFYYVDVYDSRGYKTSFVKGDKNYTAYYYRGFLEGGITALENGSVIETNMYSPELHIISPDLKVKYADSKEPDYVELKRESDLKTNMEALSENWNKNKTNFPFVDLQNGRNIIRGCLASARKGRSHNTNFFELYDMEGNLIKAEQANIGWLVDFARNKGLLSYVEAPKPGREGKVAGYIRLYKYKF